MAVNDSTRPAANISQTINGSTTTDTLSGGGGGDTIFGGAGNDLIAGDRPILGQWSYQLYSRNFTEASGQAPSITTGTLQGSGYVNDFNVEALANTTRGNTTADDFGIVYRSKLNVTQGGTYTFNTASDDGSTIIIRSADGTQQVNFTGGSTANGVLNNDFHQGQTLRSATIQLASNTTYTIEVRYWENLGGNVLSAQVGGPDTGGQLTNLATSTMIGTPDRVAGATDGADSLSGGDGNDVIVGDAGADTLQGGAGADGLDGGAGFDFVDYRDSTAGVNVDLTANTATGGSAAGDTIGGFEGVFGSASNDTLSGWAGIDSLFGGEGADTLIGLDGADSLSGGGGNDVIRGGVGADNMDGGLGLDTLDYSDSTAPVDVNLGAGTASGGFATGDQISNFEAVTGSAGADTLTGSNLADTLTGGAGSDILTGGDGADSLVGGADADTLLGGAGNDALFGGEGADSLNGGAGSDQLTGGDGNNTITVGRGDAATGGTGNDTFIVDGVIDNLTTGAEAPIAINGGDETDGGVDLLDLRALRAISDYDRVSTEDTLTGALSGTITLSDGTQISFSDIEQIICFTPGTMIRTLSGPRAIETLKVGDMVLTRDSGLQPIRWIGTSTVAGTGSFAPIRLRKGAVPDLTQDLLVSPQHRMLVEGYRAEVLFGEREVLASAKHMVDNKYVTVEGSETVTYIHMLFDQHEVIYANGAATESYHPASYGMGGICEQAREELFAIFPELRSMPESYGKTARRVIKGYEFNALTW